MTSQQPDLDIAHDAIRLARKLMVAIGYLPQSTDRTNAHGRAEEALAYVTKIAEELESA
jgi:hypothetical protein